MSNKIDEYRRRRAERLQKRLDAKDDKDEGRWVTTENDNRVHLNKNGVPDKGNPFVLAAMTGKKPKLSMNYHQKNVEKAAKSGNATNVLDELLKIPNGSKVLINGEKYKANFGDDESGRWIDFVNTEDEDDVLSTFEVAMAIQENGDVSLEAPDRKEKESAEPVYEPDIEPEESEELFPDDDIAFPDSPEDYGSISPQEEPEDLPLDMKGVNEVVPQETPDSLPSGIAPQDAGALGPSAMAGELKSLFKNQASDNISDEDYEAGYKEALAQLNGLEEGTIVKLGEKTYQKVSDPDYPFFNPVTGDSKSADWVYSDIETAAIFNDDFDLEIVENSPQSGEMEETNPVNAGNKEQATELLKSVLGLKYGDLENGEWDEAYEKTKEIIGGIPEGTEISVGGHKFQKYNDSIFPLVDAETGELHSAADLVNYLSDDSNDGVVIGSQEEDIVPQEQPVPETSGEVSAKSHLFDLIEESKNGNFVPDNEWVNTFNNLPEGTTLTNKFGGTLELVKDEDEGAYFVGPNGFAVKDSEVIQYLKDRSYGYKVNIPEESVPKEQTVQSEAVPVANTKKEKLQNALDTFKHQNKETDIIDALDALDDGDVLTVGKHTYTKTKDKSGGFFDKYTDENGTVSGNYVVKLALKEAVYLDQPVDVQSGAKSGAKPTDTAIPSTPVYSTQDFLDQAHKIQKKKDMLTSEEWEQYAGQVIAPVIGMLDDVPSGSKITVGNHSYTKQDNGVWSIDGSYYGFKENASTIAQSIAEKGINSFKSGSSGAVSAPNTTNKTSANGNAYSGVSINGSGSVENVKNTVDSFVNGAISGNSISNDVLAHSFANLENGSSIKIGNKTYIKGVNSWGEALFQNVDNVYDEVTGWGMAQDISNKAKQFGNNLKLEMSDPAHSPKKKEIAPVYIPDSIPEPKKKDSVSFSNDDFSQNRKDNAVWDTGNGQSFDNVMRGISGKVWQGLNQNAKNAVWEYTTSSAPGNYRNVNNYLRKPDHDGQSEEMQHKMKNRIGYLTKAISQSQAPQDVWVQRGIPLKNLRKLFGVSETEFNEARQNGGADAVLDLFRSSVPYGQDDGFMSCGSTKGKGFSSSDVILNVYCPKGTQMLYAEPFSAFGNGGGKQWNGTDKQSWFSSENETILQRGTKLVPTKVSYSDGKWYVDVDVIGQEYSDKI